MRKVAAILIGLTLILITIGMIAIASASPARALAEHKPENFYVMRQGIWLGISLLLGYIAAKFDYHHYRWLAVPLALLAVALLVLVLVFGRDVNGSTRWLEIGPLTFQPSEFAKVAAIIFLAWWMKRVQRQTDQAVPGLLIPGIGLGVMLGLIFIEPDFGTTMLIATVGLAMMFLGGTRLDYLIVTVVLGLSGFTIALMHNEERMNRILAFRNPEMYEQTEAFQLMNALYGFVAGGALGSGLNESLQKLYYLPEAHTDCIFAIIGEEFGLIATVGVLLAFAGLFACGMIVTFRASDHMGRLMAFGLTLMITIQAGINMGVVTGCLPTKGIALPFISYGGSSLMMSCIMMGILINIALHATAENAADPAINPIKDKVQDL